MPATVVLTLAAAQSGAYVPFFPYFAADRSLQLLVVAVAVVTVAAAEDFV